MIKPVSTSLVFICCFVLVLVPQATGLNVTRQKPVTRSSPIKEARNSQTPASQESPREDKTKPSDRRVVYQGIAVDLSVTPVTSVKGDADELREGDDALFQLRITETATGVPLRGAYPKAWMDLRERDENVDCRTRVKAFLGSGFQARPPLDLNSYYILALNQDATLSVIDPHFSYGGSKLFAMVSLKSVGEDWALTPGSRTLFVSMPTSNEVAVVNSVTWNVITNVAIGGRPDRILVQPDGHDVWVGYMPSESGDGESGVVVIGSDRLKPVARIPTGRGHHEIAFSDDNRFAFVTNGLDGTVSIIDARTRKKIKDIETGHKPASIAYSQKARMAYVADEEEGTIVAVDGSRLKIAARIQGEPGLRQIKFAPDGRFAFVANPAKDVVHILDAASNRIVQTADIGNGPEQISFSNNFAYVRCLRSEIVQMLPLPQPETLGHTVALVDFPGGQQPFGKTSNPSPADGIVKAPEEDAVLVGNPVDKTIYYYREGMAAPQGNFSNYGREPRAVLVLDRSFNERAPGVYQTTARLPRAGVYELAFATDTPRIVHCFPLRIATNPNLAAESAGVRVEPLFNNRVVWVGERVRLRFKLSDSRTQELKVGLVDVGSLIFAPGVSQQRQPAREVEKGIYEIEFQPPQAGVYYVYLESPAADLKLDNPQFLILQARDKQTP